MASSMQVAHRVARWSLDTAVLVLVVVSLALLAAGIALPALERQLLIINSGSMAPTIPAGSIIIVNERPERVAAGDVVTIRAPWSGAIFTHRVLEVRAADGEPELVTKGDANGAPDGVTYPLSSVLGVVEVAVPHIGWLVAGLQTDGGRVMLLAALLLLVALRWFWHDLFSDEPPSKTAPQAVADAQVPTR